MDVLLTILRHLADQRNKWINDNQICFFDLHFSGLSVHSVYQDFHAKMLSKNIAAVLEFSVKSDIQSKSQHLKFDHQLNFAQTLSGLKNTIVLLFKRPYDVMVELAGKICKIYIQTTEPVRPGCKFPRRHHNKQARFFNEYKTVP